MSVEDVHGKILTYTDQPGNLVCWRLGEACSNAAADPKCGDPIDRGLILLMHLAKKGYGVVYVGGDDHDLTCEQKEKPE
jgi:hypothetical protein